MESWNTKAVLKHIAEAGDQMSVDALERLCRGFGRGGGLLFHHRVISPGLAEWVRSSHRQSSAAIAVRLTDAGRAALQ